MTCNDEPSPLLRPRNAKETRSVSVYAFIRPGQRCPSRRRTDRPRTIGDRVSISTPHSHALTKSSYLSDILVSHSADLLDIGSTLGNVLERVTREDELILLGGGSLNINTGVHNNTADELLADEVSDLNLEQVGLGVLGDVDVDGEMGVDVSHLVLEALGDTDDQVVDDGSDSSEGSDILADTVVNLNGDLVLLGAGEVDGQVAEILDQLAAGTLDGDNSRLNGNLDCRHKTSQQFGSCGLTILDIFACP